MAFVLNIIAIGLMIYFTAQTDSCKSPIIFMVFYPALTFLNLIIAMILKILKAKQAKIYKQLFIGELILFIPLVVIISQFL